MGHSKRYYDELADRLAVDALPLEEGDTAAAFVVRLRSEISHDVAVEALAASLASEALGVATGARAPGESSGTLQPLTIRWRRRVMISAFLSTLFGKIAVGTVAVAVAATGAAATGNLPDPAQQAVSDALSNVGIEVPAPDDAVGSTDMEIPDTSEGPEATSEVTAPVLPEEASDTSEAVTDTVFSGDPATGRELGEAVSDIATDGAVGDDAPELPAKPELPVIPGLPEAVEFPEALAIPELPEDAE